MSRARGNALPNAFAEYLRPWWPHAQSVGSGRNGRDILSTPGVAWEIKTADDFKRDFKPTLWVAQSKLHLREPGEVPVVVYFPRGIGAQNCAHTLSIVPTHVQMQLLQEAGYTWSTSSSPSSSSLP